MASSSTSHVQKRFKYDVFVSFRGEDVRKTFVDHLYAALDRQGILTFRDDKRLKKGERIDDELIKSIQDSKFFIIVFTQHYASSSWCLNELVEIMEYQKNAEQTAYPVFYDVDPSEVRKQRESYGEALSKHNNEEVNKWRQALREAGSVSGYDVKNTVAGHEAECIKLIVAEISKQLRSTYYLSNDKNLVGMETRIPHLLSCLDINSNDVRMIGIKGMGGAGKTTLATEIFRKIYFMFEGVSFVDNVRKNSKASASGLQSLQGKVLSDVLKEKIKISSSVEGKQMMENRLGRIKALVVLDDVDDSSQLEALAGSSEWFKPGSRIIITTRDEQVLKEHGVEIKHDVNLLLKEEAISLFNRHAFKGEIPMEWYAKYACEVVRYAAGLPLTIKVLGSSLHDKAESFWIDVIGRLKSIPLKATMDVLELSYNDLEDDHKEIFLDVACFLNHTHKKHAIKMLQFCGFHAICGLTVLQQKSLITFSQSSNTSFSNDGDDNNVYVDMHDQIQEMGQHIVRRKHNMPSKHTRLWVHKEIEDELVNKLGTKATRYIKLESTRLHPEVIMNGLKDMNNLKYLLVYGFYSRDSDWKCDEGSQYFPNALQYLRWSSYPYCSLPKRFEAKNLVALEMQFSKIEQLWEGGSEKVLHNLKFLDLSHSTLTKLDLRLAPNLEDLKLAYCYSLSDMSVVSLKLRAIDISHSKLRELYLVQTPNLEVLKLEQCRRLSDFHMSVECPKLRSIHLSNSNLMKLDFGPTPDLEVLKLENSPWMLDLRWSVGCPKLRSLVCGPSLFQKLDPELFPNLETLVLERKHTSYEPFIMKCIHIALTKLTSLTIISSKVMMTFDLRLCPYLVYCEFLFVQSETFHLALTSKLKMLKLKRCYKLKNFYLHVGCPEQLSDLKFVGCSGLNVLTEDQKLHDLTNLSLISNDDIKFSLPFIYEVQASSFF